MLDKDAALWLGKIVLIIIVLGAVIGFVGGVGASAFFPEVAESTVFHAVVGGLVGIALVFVLGDRKSVV